MLKQTNDKRFRLVALRPIPKELKGKVCSKCRHWLPFSRYSRRSKGSSSGYRSECKGCQSDYNRQNSYKASPQKHRIRQRTRYAVQTQKLKKEPCERCGTKKNVQAHHTEYDSPLAHLESVMWLCRSCHSYEHSTHIAPGQRCLFPPNESNRNPR